ncbi:CPBP family intramembrane glutamic endopeptidase [Pontibacillus salicampi]|uniref:CPBP family intramembrane glutamic endopeptidase n=1 Tax=Pontibacillus salicampi TaxID=1449801 RepID=A0ABV6LMR5_9BACI
MIILYLLIPTLMIVLGLTVFQHVLLTFLLFYGWFTLLIFRRWQRGWRPAFHLTGSGWWVGIGSGVFFGSTVFVSMWLLQEQLFDKEQLDMLLANWGFSGASVYGLIAVLLLINPVLEELYWRGTIHEQLRSRLSCFQTIVLTSCFYSLYHFFSIIPLVLWPFTVLCMIAVFVAGCFWGYIRERTGSVTVSIVSHALADAGIMGVYWFFLR